MTSTNPTARRGPLRALSTSVMVNLERSALSLTLPDPYSFLSPRGLGQRPAVQHRVPFDILSMIFDLALEPDWFSEKPGWREFLDEQPIDEQVDNIFDGLPRGAFKCSWDMAFAFAGVCKRWRHVACSMPLLWTTMVITSRRLTQLLENLYDGEHLVHRWIEQSKNQQVRLLIDFRDINWDAPGLRSHFVGLTERDAGSKRLQMTSDVMKLLTYNCRNWESFGLAIRGRPQSEAIITGLCKGAKEQTNCQFTSLKWFSLTIDPSEDKVQLWLEPEKPRMLRWGNPECMPNLRTMLLRNVPNGVVARGPAPCLPGNLRRLVLDLSENNVRFFSAAAFVGMLRSCPHLEELNILHRIVETLDGGLAHTTIAGSPLPPSAEADMQRMPALRLLSLQRVEPLYVVQIWDHLNLTELEELTLDIWPGPGDLESPQQLFDKIVADPPQYPWQHLHNLRRLYVPAFERQSGLIDIDWFQRLLTQPGPAQLTHLVCELVVAIHLCGAREDDHARLKLPELTHLHALDPELATNVAVWDNVEGLTYERNSRDLAFANITELGRALSERLILAGPLEEILLPNWLMDEILLRAETEDLWANMQSYAKRWCAVPARFQRTIRHSSQTRVLNRCGFFQERDMRVFPLWGYFTELVDTDGSEMED
ncbi:hypothetical protein BKA62DRAFT_768974 [Auriculariales sp. MPI-PUGE-AT-0066]|nr:hypothetical protein BKA62DRAFT_768974 [Auriculariales sp. MPI-PUGE-AT-0066]